MKLVVRITNNTSPLGKEIFIKWNATKLLFTKFNDNDWGDEDPTDPDVIDPNHVTKRSKVTSTKKSNLLNEMNLDLLNRYSDILKDYFPSGYFDSDDNVPEDNNQNPQMRTTTLIIRILLPTTHKTVIKILRQIIHKITIKIILLLQPCHYPAKIQFK